MARKPMKGYPKLLPIREIEKETSRKIFVFSMAASVRVPLRLAAHSA
jgi:hypothetical protein